MTTCEKTASAVGTCGCEDVCDLPSDERRRRIATIRREILPRATRREVLTDGVALDFEHSGAMHQALEDLIAFESECCGGLEWRLHRPPDGGLRLTIRGLAPDSDFFRALWASADAPRFPRLARLAKAGAFGSGIALLLCCVAPMAVAALAGAAVAAPITKLDDPWIMAVASVALTVPVWLWLHRRGARAGVGGSRCC